MKIWAETCKQSQFGKKYFSQIYFVLPNFSQFKGCSNFDGKDTPTICSPVFRTEVIDWNWSNFINFQKSLNCKICSKILPTSGYESYLWPIFSVAHSTWWSLHYKYKLRLCQLAYRLYKINVWCSDDNISDIIIIYQNNW